MGSLEASYSTMRESFYLEQGRTAKMERTFKLLHGYCSLNDTDNDTSLDAALQVCNSNTATPTLSM